MKKRKKAKKKLRMWKYKPNLNNEHTDVHKLNDPEIFKALSTMLCGKKLGNGASRDVYNCAIDKSLVVKIETDGRGFKFQNIIEWEVWNEVKYSDNAKWFAECVAISPCGRIMLQRKAKLPKNVEYPKKVPAFFTDLGKRNYGFIKDQFVCIDYGLSLGSKHTLHSKKMKNARWEKDWRSSSTT